MPFFAAMKGNVKALHLGSDYAFRKHPSYHGMIPCLLGSHSYWSVSGGIAHSAVAMPLVGSTGTSNPPTLTLWRSWTLGTQPLRHLREWVQGQPGSTGAQIWHCLCCLMETCTPRLLQSWPLALVWHDLIFLWCFFFSGFGVGLLTSSGQAWFVSLEIFFCTE